MSDEAEFEVIVDGEYYATVYGKRDDAFQEALGYAFGETKVEIYEVIRKFICIVDELE